MFKNQGFSAVAIIIILAVLALGGYWVQKERVKDTATCTADAKFCTKSDNLEDRLLGGSVGRRPPTCDFVPCPNDNLITKISFWFKDKLATLFYFK